MARLYTTGLDINTVTAGVDWATLNNTAPTSQTGTVHTAGGRALEWNLTTSVGAIRQKVYSGNQARVGYSRAYFRFASFPGSTTRLMIFQNASNNPQAIVAITSAGALQLQNSSGTQIGSSSAAMSLNTWYRIEHKIDATGSGTAEACLDGVVFASGANNVQGTWTQAVVGISSTSVTVDMFVDDWAINDDTGGSQNSYPGPANVYTILENATGDAQGFTVQVGGSAGTHYTSVNENPPDDATSYVSSVVAAQSELYGFTDLSLGAAAISVVHVQARHTNLVAADATTSFKTQIEKTTGGTVAQSAAVIPNSTSWVTGQVGLPCMPIQTLYLDPDGGAWTGTTIDSLQAGVTVGAGNVRAVAITTVWVVVEQAIATTYASTLAATLNFTGSRIRASAKGLTGATLNFTGSQKRKTGSAKAGTLNFTGTMLHGSLTFLSLSATLSFAGAVARKTGRGFSATLSLAASLVRNAAAHFGSALTFNTAGVGVLAPYGGGGYGGPMYDDGPAAVSALTMSTGKHAAATLALAGALGRGTGRAFAGVLNLAGSLRRTAGKPLTAALTLTGTLGVADHVARVFTATLTLVGTQGRAVGKRMAATLAVAGSFTRALRRSFSATLQLIGSMVTGSSITQWVFGFVRSRTGLGVVRSRDGKGETRTR